MSSGLDIQAVSAFLPTIDKSVKNAQRIIGEHASETEGYVAWSGGKDSTCVMVLVKTLFPEMPIVWFNSGLEYPENVEYIYRLAEKYSLNFHEIKAEPDALTFLKESGLWDHSSVYGGNHGDDLHEILITGPSRIAHEKFGAGELVGLRAEESVGRRILLASGNGRYVRKNGEIVSAPLWRWSVQTVEGFLHKENVPENPVYARLRGLGAPLHAQRVGLVVDGNAAEYGRYTWLRAGWPELWSDLCEVLPRLREWR